MWKATDDISDSAFKCSLSQLESNFEFEINIIYFSFSSFPGAMNGILTMKNAEHSDLIFH